MGGSGTFHTIDDWELASGCMHRGRRWRLDAPISALPTDGLLSSMRRDTRLLFLT